MLIWKLSSVFGHIFILAVIKSTALYHIFVFVKLFSLLIPQSLTTTPISMNCCSADNCWCCQWEAIHISHNFSSQTSYHWLELKGLFVLRTYIWDTLEPIFPACWAFLDSTLALITEEVWATSWFNRFEARIKIYQPVVLFNRP